MAFPADDQAAEVVEPGEQPFDLPAPAVTPQFASVLCRAPPPVGFMRGNQGNAALVPQPLIECVTVVGPISDQALGLPARPARIERRLDQGHFMRASACNPQGDRKTSAVDNGHDFRAFAPFGGSHARPPFLAGTKLPSIN